MIQLTDLTGVNWCVPNDEELDVLAKINSETNDGRGSSVVAGALAFARKGEFAAARRTVYFDWDKLRQYPRLAGYVKWLFDLAEDCVY